MSETIRQAFTNFLAEFKYRWHVVAADFFALTLAWFLSFWVWSNFGVISDILWDLALKYFLFVVFTQSLIFIAFRVHRSLWKFVSTRDMLRVLGALILGTATSAFVVFGFDRLEFLPRGIFAVDFVLASAFTLGIRAIYRLVMDRQWRKSFSKKALVIGAGASGENVVRNLLRADPSVYKPIGFIDDDPKKAGQIMHGVKVIGNSDIIPEIVKRNDVDLILFAIHKASSSEVQHIVEQCEKTDAELRILPRFDDMVDGRKDVTANFRKLKLEDLLGREPVSLVLDELRAQYQGKSVLVTGGGGSIGSELCNQIARYNPREIILVDHSEYNLYKVDSELEEDFPHIKRVINLGDICDKRLLKRIFDRHRPDLVFHAAAYKHVPLLERQCAAGITNNIIGTKAVADMALAYKAEKFVLISTDKAVNPSSLMGATKRIAEMYCQNLNGDITRFVTVRFGNVLGSAGSVVPRFQHQIEKGGPVTVTHPDMERYFMTITEACQLILTAGKYGRGGEIFVLDMGRPIKILFLADQMIRMAGLIPSEDIQISISGIREGEKLTEILFHEEEMSRNTGHDRLFLANGRIPDGALVNSKIHLLEKALDAEDEYTALQVVAQLVPEVLSDSLVFSYMQNDQNSTMQQTAGLSA